jgi:hypothetical protein
MIREELTGNDVEVPRPNSWHYPGITLEGLRKIAKKFMMSGLRDNI